MSARVDIESWPPEKPHLIDLAKRHNMHSDDLDRISGETPDEKAAMHKLFGILKKPAIYMHGNRYNVFLFTLQVSVLTWFLKSLGVNVELIGGVINKLLTYMANQ